MCSVFVSLVAASLGCPDPVHAGAWLQEESGGLVLVQSTLSRSDAAYNGGGSLYAGDSYDKVVTQLAFEFGAADWLTLLVAPERLSVSVGADAGGPAATYRGFGYTDFGARVRFAKGEDWILSGQAVLRVPGVPPGSDPASIGYRTGEMDIRMMLGLAFTLCGLPTFLDLELGQRLRTGAPPDEIHVDSTVGVRFWEGWMALAQVFAVVSEGAGQGPDFDLSYAYVKGQMGVMVDVTPDLSLMLACVTTLAARNAIQENGLVAAVLYRF